MAKVAEEAPKGHEVCFDGLFNRANERPCPACIAAYERVKAELGPPPFPFGAWLRQGVRQLARGFRWSVQR